MRKTTRLIGSVAALLALAIPAVQAASFAYVPFNSSTGWVTVIDLENYKQVKNISVGSNPDTVAVSADGSRVYVTNRVANSVSVIDAHSNEVIATIDNVGTVPSGIAVHPLNNKVYVSHQAGVAVIDGATIVTNIDAPYAGQGIMITPDGLYAFVVGSDGIAAIETASGVVVDSLALGTDTGPRGVALSPNGQQIFLANEGKNTVVGDGSLSIIDVENYSQAQFIRLVETRLSDPFSDPYDVSVDANGNYLYVADNGNGTVTALDLTAFTPTVVTTLDLATEGTMYLGDCFAGSQPIHTMGVSAGVDGKIYAAKNVWCSSEIGTYLSRLEWSNGELLETGSLYLNNRELSYVFGQFVGPECAECPRSFVPADPYKAYERPAAVGPVAALGLAGLVALGRFRRRRRG